VIKAYAGIGSRETPKEILGVMRTVAEQLGRKGWTLRSGAADGADRAFEEGAWDAHTPLQHYRYVAGPRPEIYLPWPSFNEGKRAMTRSSYYVSEPQPEAYEIARQHHPAWDRLSRGGRALHARNVHQILGPDVTAPFLSRFVLCWTKGGAGGGGTGQALRIARHYEVVCFDLAIQSDFDRITGGLFA
jgi:hypothetical protein